ncbi:hypothetical protein J6590_047676 [Homalodisca vitripennis]|nr:hypothetical protein J6590_047676 [Homalodisca vitripennis]
MYESHDFSFDFNSTTNATQLNSERNFAVISYGWGRSYFVEIDYYDPQRSFLCISVSKCRRGDGERGGGGDDQLPVKCKIELTTAPVPPPIKI